MEKFTQLLVWIQLVHYSAKGNFDSFLKYYQIKYNNSEISNISDIEIKGLLLLLSEISRRPDGRIDANDAR